MVRLLLKKKGALANKARNDGLTPLITASINGHPKVVKRLLKHAVDIHSTWRRKDCVQIGQMKRSTPKIITFLERFKKGQQQANDLKSDESSAKPIHHRESARGKSPEKRNAKAAGITKTKQKNKRPI